MLQEGLLQLEAVLSALEPLHRPIEAPGGSVLLRELAGAGSVPDATLSAQATPLLHALTAAHAYIMMFVHTCRVGQVKRTGHNAWKGDNPPPPPYFGVGVIIFFSFPRVKSEQFR